MHKIVRTLTMAGLGLLAGASLGAPALASDSGAKSTGKSSGTQVQQGWDRTYVQGYYRTLRGCKKVGAVGDWAGKWDNPRCFPVRIGFRRGLWALKVQKEWRGNGHVIIARDRDYHVNRYPGIYRNNVGVRVIGQGLGNKPYYPGQGLGLGAKPYYPGLGGTAGTTYPVPGSTAGDTTYPAPADSAGTGGYDQTAPTELRTERKR
jgi:hypothetical protein